ncbi:2-dehydropantoate 2-reductase [Bacillus sp. BHET2]|uniref:2-dehydropantoate 2-reductase n=1 Tax=Bacillus sp. BHET2 TaxID=2583818 RepID=UPI00110D26B1|nr:2-dehydropantoate 2-reductase [Bacillus sp. BHET2]TMU87883.1 2-dehydropantoate 2-reductase [Bacillus sp. BHET2]
MKIGIVGGGSIGLLFAGYLGELFDVTLIVRRESQVNALLRNGVTIHKESTSITTIVQATTSMKAESDFNLVIVTVKEYDLSSIENELIEIGITLPILFVQNGIGHINWVKSLPHPNLVAASVEHGAMRVNDDTVRHLGEAKTNIALIRGEWGVVEEVAAKSIDTFPFLYKSDYEEMLLSKLFINVLINPLTALTGVTNGKLVDNPHFHRIQRELFHELLLLFPHMEGIISIEDVIGICHNTYLNRSSMLKDIETLRKTEIESILGVLLERAHEENHFVPIMNILYSLVKGIEREGLGG